MKKILFVAQNLNMGGVQKALVNTINSIDYNSYSVEVFSFAPGVLSKQVPNNVKIRYGKKALQLLLTPLSDIRKTKKILDIVIRYILIILCKLIGIKNVYSFLFTKEKIKDEYDIAISYFNDVFAGVSNRGTNWFVTDFINASRKVAWIHTDPIKANFNINECRETYRKFDYIACVSKGIKDKFDQVLPEYSGKTGVVYNYFPVDYIREMSEEDEENWDRNQFNLVSIGRIENASKRIDRIIRVCSLMVADGYKNFVWHIIGDGPDMNAMKELAKVNKLENCIDFVGQKVNPYPYLKQGDLFVLTSDYEGYPMVIGEAFILGIPVVTTNFAAASEMIVDKVNGIICDMDEQLIKETIECIIDDNSFLASMKDTLQDHLFVNEHWDKQIHYALEGKELQ